MSPKLKCWMINDKFGQPSTVWMYRQATQMQRIELSFVTNEHEGTENYPASNISVHDYSKATDQPIVGLQRIWKSKNPDTSRPKRWDWIRGLLKQDCPDVVMFQYGRNAIKYAKFFYDQSIPSVVQFNGYDLSRAVQDDKYCQNLVDASKYVTGFVVVADYMKDWLVQNGICETKIRKIPYGSPIEEFQVSTHVGDAPCVFLAVGNFVEKKRHDLTIKAFARCLDQVPTAKLRIIGGGAIFDKCQNLVDELEIKNSVTFLGAQSSTVVREEMTKASVFVQHSVTDSHGDKEGWPVALGEASASGLPIVSTYHASIPDQVENGVTGFLVEEHNWMEMGEKMKILAADPELRKKMGIAARVKAEQCSTRHQIDQLEEFLSACALAGIGLRRSYSEVAKKIIEKLGTKAISLVGKTS